MGIVEQLSSFIDSKDITEIKEFLSVILFFSLFLYSYTEPFKIMLRKKIGLGSISLAKTLLASILFFAWALVLSVVLFADQGEAMSYLFSYNGLLPKSFLIIGITFYGVLSFYTLYKGMDEYYKAKFRNNGNYSDYNYRGESRFNIESDDKKRWLTVEPRIAIIISAILLIISPALGIPVFFSAISFALNEWYNIQYKTERIKRQLIESRLESEKMNALQNQITDLNATENRVIVD